MECVRVLFVLVSILVAPIAARSSRQYRCRTPDGGVSTCITLRSCKTIVDFVEKTEITNDIINFLSKYTCDPDRNGNQRVCCPSSLPNFESGRDYSTHRNIGLLPLTSCGMSSPTDRITNGNKTSLFEYPWAAALKFDVSIVPYRCGGSLINNRYVLTAAHCVRGPDKMIGLRLGEHDFSTEIDCDVKGEERICAPPPQDFDITEQDIIVHPKYNTATQENDIALIRLKKGANINGDSVAPVCLPITIPEQTHNFENFTVIGWGRTEDSLTSPILLKVLVPKVEHSKCAPLYSFRTVLTDKQLCAGGRNAQDSCGGDSGGPLTAEFVDDGLVKTVQYGLVSMGPRACGREEFPVVYSKVSKYVGWILDNIRS